MATIHTWTQHVDAVSTRVDFDAPVNKLSESFETYYHRDYRSLVGLAYVLTGSQWVAEDLAQEALAEAHRRWAVVGEYDRPGAWVRRVMVNKSTSRFRKLKTETRMLLRVGQLPAETLNPSEPHAELWAAVRQLPLRQAQSIVLHYVEDRTVAEIAEVLEIGTESVKTHLKRARKTLAGLLEDERGSGHG